MLPRREQLSSSSISLPIERKKEAKKDASVRSTDKFLSIRRRKGSPMRRDATRGQGTGDGGTTRESVGKYRKRPDNGPRRPRLTFCSFIKPSGTRARARGRCASRSQVTRFSTIYSRDGYPCAISASTTSRKLTRCLSRYFLHASLTQRNS